MSGKSLEVFTMTMYQQFIGNFGYCDEYDYLAKTSERDGSKKVDVELKIA